MDKQSLSCQASAASKLSTQLGRVPQIWLFLFRSASSPESHLLGSSYVLSCICSVSWLIVSFSLAEIVGNEKPVDDVEKPFKLKLATSKTSEGHHIRFFFSNRSVPNYNEREPIKLNAVSSSIYPEA